MDFVKQVVEQFTAKKTMDVVHDALGLDPQCKESAQLVTVIGPSQDMVAEEDVMEIVGEERVGEIVEDKGFSKCLSKETTLTFPSTLLLSVLCLSWP